MLAILQYAFIFLMARSLSLLCVVLPSGIEEPVRIQELKLMHIASSQGPGGFDDAVQMAILKNPDKYAGPLVNLLNNSTPGSSQENLALSYIELVMQQPGVSSSLTAFGAKHPTPEVQRLVTAILSSKVPGRVAP